MGQQQLLLIVLGVILVGVAVVLGIQYFGVGAEAGAKDELVAHVMTIGANAQEWYKKPAAMGGGDLKFTGFKNEFDNNLTNLHNSTNGVYTVPADGGLTSVVIHGAPIAALNYDWVVDCTVTTTGMTTEISVP